MSMLGDGYHPPSTLTLLQKTNQEASLRAWSWEFQGTFKGQWNIGLLWRD